MRIRVLMIGDANTNADALFLKEKGMLVYRCIKENMHEMINELDPDAILVNFNEPQNNISTECYHQLLDNVKYAHYPIIYTMMEDDVYLVNRKRTISKGKRTVIADNLIDSIRTAILPISSKHTLPTRKVPTHNFAHRA